MQDFKGKVAVVTGGASGIGFGLAERFAREGCKLVLADIEAQALERAVEALAERRAEVIGVQTDVSKRASVENLLAKTLERYGRVHVLCNNAGVQLAAPSWLITEQEWQWILGVNLWGVIHGISVFVPRMLAQGEEGHIVNTSSIAGLLSLPFMAAYQVSKHGVVTLSESLYQELKQQGSSVGVSVLCPAFVQTNLHESDRNRPAEASETLLPKEVQAVIKQSTTQLVTSGKPVSEIVDIVFHGIRNQRLFILTHPELNPAIQERTARMVRIGSDG